MNKSDTENISFLFMLELSKIITFTIIIRDTAASFTITVTGQ